MPASNPSYPAKVQKTASRVPRLPGRLQLAYQAKCTVTHQIKKRTARRQSEMSGPNGDKQGNKANGPPTKEKTRVSESEELVAEMQQQLAGALRQRQPPAQAQASPVQLPSPQQPIDTQR